MVSNKILRKEMMAIAKYKPGTDCIHLKNEENERTTPLLKNTIL